MRFRRQGANVTVLSGADGVNGIAAGIAGQGMAILNALRDGLQQSGQQLMDNLPPVSEEKVEPMPEAEQRLALEAGGIREAGDEGHPAPRRRAARKRPAS